jgi:hypothetical protein
MITAARGATEYTRPLSLYYYGLAQAGMAIVAAHAEDPWSFSRNGLALDNVQAGLGDITVRPEGDGGFQRVATATGSPLVAEPVTLGALWSSLPDLPNAGVLPGGKRPRPLELNSWEWMTGAFRQRCTCAKTCLQARQSGWPGSAKS